MKQTTHVFASMAFGLSLAACGSTAVNGTSPGGTPSGSSADSMMAQQSVQSASDASSSDSATANYSPGNAGKLDIPFSSTVGIDGCTVDVTGTLNASLTGFALDANFVFDGNSCKGRRVFSGTEDVVASWSTTDSNSRTLQVTANLSATSDGNTLTIEPLTAGVPNWTVDASGLSGNGNVSLSIADSEHRILKGSDGNSIFDISINSNPNAPLIFTNSYDVQTGTAAGATLQSGVSVVRHNLAKFTATHTFSSLALGADGTCLCPVSGSLTQVVTVDAGGGYTRTYTFSGCGTATVVTTDSTLSGTSNGTASVTWDNCN